MHMCVCVCCMQIQRCDAILEHMEGLLGRFQSDLGQVSDEIRTLQVRWPLNHFVVDVGGSLAQQLRGSSVACRY